MSYDNKLPAKVSIPNSIVIDKGQSLVSRGLATLSLSSLPDEALEERFERALEQEDHNTALRILHVVENRSLDELGGFKTWYADDMWPKSTNSIMFHGKHEEYEAYVAEIIHKADRAFNFIYEAAELGDPPTSAFLERPGQASLKPRLAG